MPHPDCLGFCNALELTSLVTSRTVVPQVFESFLVQLKTLSVAMSITTDLDCVAGTVRGLYFLEQPSGVDHL